MANPIPPPDVPFCKVVGDKAIIETTWYEFLKGIKLSSLPDVQLTALANGDAPVWDSTALKWKNVAN